MNTRGLAILALLAVVSVGATAAVLRTGTATIASDHRGEPVLAGLADNASEINALVVRQDSETMSIERRDAGYVESGSGYPVKGDAVREVVASAIDLRFDESRTSDPGRYGDLGLAEPGSANAGKEIIFRTARGDLGDIIVGNRDSTLGGPAGGVFLRLKGQPQSWLVRGSVKLPSGRADWFAPLDLDVGRNQIEKIELAGGGLENVVVKTSADKPGEFTVENVPEKRVTDTAKVSRLTTLLERFSFQDVRKRSKPADESRRMTVDVQDGLRLVITVVGEVSEGWVQLSAQATSDAKKDRAGTIAAKVDGFHFRLAPNQIEALGWTTTDLTSEQRS
jgi:hypothetical protein